MAGKYQMNIKTKQNVYVVLIIERDNFQLDRNEIYNQLFSKEEIHEII